MSLVSLAVFAVEPPVKIGVRVGVNTSNISGTHKYNNVSGIQTTSWEAGFSAGAIVDIRMANHIYVQPGFYYMLNRSSYTTSIEISGINGESIPVDIARHSNGELTTSWFQIPVLFSYRWNFSFVELQGDFGPYFALGLSGKAKEEIRSFSGDITNTSATIETDAFGNGSSDLFYNKDWGFKMGIGGLFAKHYYVGIHYQIGARNLAQDKTSISKSHRYAWDFTIGYNF